jgi:hypothetical protein
MAVLIDRKRCDKPDYQENHRCQEPGGIHGYQHIEFPVPDTIRVPAVSVAVGNRDASAALTATIRPIGVPSFLRDTRGMAAVILVVIA